MLHGRWTDETVSQWNGPIDRAVRLARREHTECCADLSMPARARAPGSRRRQAGCEEEGGRSAPNRHTSVEKTQQTQQVLGLEPHSGRQEKKTTMAITNRSEGAPVRSSSFFKGKRSCARTTMFQQERQTPTPSTQTPHHPRQTESGGASKRAALEVSLGEERFWGWVWSRSAHEAVRGS